MMRLLSAALLFVSSVAFASPEGYWRTVDDETGNTRSVVHITVKDGVATGTIVQLYRQPGEDHDPDCTACKGELNGKKVIGLDILTGMNGDGTEWDGGNIMDPNNGKTYGCKIEEQDGDKKLKVRGFLGISLLGRTQYWYRVGKPDLSIRTFLLNGSGKAIPLVYSDGREASAEEISAHLGQ